MFPSSHTLAQVGFAPWLAGIVGVTNGDGFGSPVCWESLPGAVVALGVTVGETDAVTVGIAESEPAADEPDSGSVHAVSAPNVRITGPKNTMRRISRR
jgi:hypothetical protein